MPNSRETLSRREFIKLTIMGAGGVALACTEGSLPRLTQEIEYPQGITFETNGPVMTNGESWKVSLDYNKAYKLIGYIASHFGGQERVDQTIDWLANKPLVIRAGGYKAHKFSALGGFIIDGTDLPTSTPTIYIYDSSLMILGRQASFETSSVPFSTLAHEMLHFIQFIQYNNNPKELFSRARNESLTNSIKKASIITAFIVGVLNRTKAQDSTSEKLKKAIKSLAIGLTPLIAIEAAEEVVKDDQLIHTSEFDKLDRLLGAWSEFAYLANTSLTLTKL